MQRNQHTAEFQEQALSKARTRGERTLESVAAELNMSLGTLKGWLKRSQHPPAGLPHAATLPGDVAARQWTAGQRLLALHESHPLSGPALHAWCREHGLFEHQLLQWRQAFCALDQTPAAEQRSAAAALSKLQAQNKGLQSELHRKDRALAEAAALLVLQKKFRALVLQESEGEDK